MTRIFALDLTHWRGPELLLGEGLRVRVATADDVGPDYVDGLNHPDIARWVSPGTVHTTQSVRDYVARIDAASNALLMGLFAPDGKLLGTSRMHDIARGGAWLGIAILDRALHGRGLGRRFLEALCGFAFCTLCVHAIHAGIAPGNIASMRAFRAGGFVPLLAGSGVTVWRRCADDRIFGAYWSALRAGASHADWRVADDALAADLLTRIVTLAMGEGDVLALLAEAQAKFPPAEPLLAYVARMREAA